ncbi:hypothetical protein [Absidia glauca]|uniref:Uncharacterized protein n=1 Tax=Absidia glauca TaxID=4829 RepID=A0A163JAM0_ABSGL|nr:hypothetical protein [Absidia glauca]
MYFSLPTVEERQQQQQPSNSGSSSSAHLSSSSSASLPSLPTLNRPTPSTSTPRSLPPNMNFLTDERLLEIVENLEDHWRSPPILTPTTLAVIFNNRHNDISSPFPPLRLNSTSEKNTISTASLQCFLSQFQKMVAQHIPPLEKIIQDDAILCGIRDGDTSIPPLSALDHLTQILATMNQGPSLSN